MHAFCYAEVLFRLVEIAILGHGGGGLAERTFVPSMRRVKVGGTHLLRFLLQSPSMAKSPPPLTLMKMMTTSQVRSLATSVHFAG